ncbi:phosphoribosyltransferase [Sulfolobus sp. S-194]|uniref:phosphoribosyltransferase family protein n=1 Tax=Sulfolobus sp. S-194 TaxID=2512240 RepID=UPI00143722F9|nr:phosphoribosyltransferase family protein [Sulfolobus sp. S-194]QIW25291.1 phosphoribosyltransferase [Sulfolobus sp. S-194]
MQKDKDLRLRLTVVDLLKELKNSFTYKELAKIFNIQESLLCRYVNGSTIPSEVHAKEILDKLKSRDFLVKFLLNKIIIHDDGYIDTSRLLFYPNLLKILIEMYYYRFFENKEITKIATVAVNGIPFATLTAEALAKPLIIIKKHKDSMFIDYIDESLKEADGVITSIFLRKDYISKNDKILLIDDVIRSGKTITTATKLIRKSGADIVGVLVIASVGNEWSKHINGVPIKPLFVL